VAKPKHLPKGDIAKTALAIIDQEGLDKLTVRRLASELGISGPTLYHHYRDRDDILYTVVRLVMAENSVPASRPPNALDALIEASRASYLARAAHPNAIPLFRVEYLWGVFSEWYEYLVGLLEDVGIPPGETVAVLFLLEALITGIVEDNANRLRAEESLRVHQFDGLPRLEKALQADSLMGVPLVDKAVRSLILGWRVTSTGVDYSLTKESPMTTSTSAVSGGSRSLPI
jgi:AcrR family transcriptional regulator